MRTRVATESGHEPQRVGAGLAPAALTYQYAAPRCPDIVAGTDSIEKLGQLCDGYGVRRAHIITSPSLVAEGVLLSRATAALGPRHAGTFTRVERHSPLRCVQDAVSAVAASGADGIVSIGGGSSVDTAKGVIWYQDLEQRRPPMPHLCVPTTLSGAEYTTDAGITIDAGKRPLRSQRLVPSVVVNDPAAVATAGLDLLRPSLVNALAHCLEGAVSINGSPMTDAFYLHAMRLLRASSARLDTPAGLANAQAGSALAAIHQVPMGLAHALVHVVGGRLKTPHGMTHGIIAPIVMWFNARTCSTRQLPIADAFGAPANGMGGRDTSLGASRAVQAFIKSLGLPTGFRDLGVDLDSLESLAPDVVHDVGFATNPRPLASWTDVTPVLRAAWSGELDPAWW